MRLVLRLLGTRYGIALVLVLLVFVVVAVFRGVAGTRDTPLVAPPLEPSRSATTPTAGDDGVAHADVAGKPSPSLAEAAATEVKTVTGGFAAAWLRHTGVTSDQWRGGLAPYATPALLAKLKGVDPAGVPAARTTGDIRLTVRDTALTVASVPLDAGTLRLTLVLTGGRWKVDRVDWDAPR